MVYVKCRSLYLVTTVSKTTNAYSNGDTYRPFIYRYTIMEFKCCNCLEMLVVMIKTTDDAKITSRSSSDIVHVDHTLKKSQNNLIITFICTHITAYHLVIYN